MTEFLDTEEAAQFLRHSPTTLESWRAFGAGPKFYKPSGKVVYLKDDLIEWVKSSQENKFFMGKYFNGQKSDLIKCNAGFPLKDGGGYAIECHIICDENQVIAFVPSESDAEKIVDLLNRK